MFKIVTHASVRRVYHVEAYSLGDAINEVTHDDLDPVDLDETDEEVSIGDSGPIPL